MAPAVAPPVLSLAPDLLQDFDMSNGPELFLMDDAEFVQQDCHINTFATLEVDVAQAQVRRDKQSRRHSLISWQTCGCACAQFTKIEAGSAYRSLAGQLAIPFAETPVRSLPLETTYRTDPSATTTSLLDVLPAATLPRDIASPVETPSIAISHWPQGVSFPEQAYYSNELYDSPDLKFDDLLNTPSNSFQSTTSSWMTRTEAQRFHDLSFADEDLLSPTTAPSSFDLGSVNPSNSASFPSEAQGFQYLGCPEDDLPTSFTAPFSFNTLPTQPPNPPSFPSPSRFLPLDPSNHLSQPLTQPTTPLQPADLSMETWARGTYNVSDRTNYGSLVPPNPTRRKRKPPSLASLTTPPNKCPTCTKTFPSRSERE
jgi:hypothetical protein